MINIYQPQLGEEELQAIKRVFKSNWIGRGKLEQQFKDDIATNLRTETTDYGYTCVKEYW